MHFLIRGIVAKSVFENIDELLNELKAEPEYKRYFDCCTTFTYFFLDFAPFGYPLAKKILSAKVESIFLFMFITYLQHFEDYRLKMPLDFPQVCPKVFFLFRMPPMQYAV